MISAVRTAVLVLLAIPGCRPRGDTSTTPPAASQPDIGAVVEVLRTRHVDGDRIPAGERDLQRAIAALRDPWTRAYTQPQAEVLTAGLMGTAQAGIGLPELLSIDLDAKGEHLEVVAPMPGSAADEAQLGPHDRVVAIEGKPVDAARYMEAMDALRVPEQGKVRLTVEREGTPREVVLVATALPAYVPVSGSREGDTLVVRFGTFGPDSGKAFADLLARESPKALELDLRGHTGGALDAVLAIVATLSPEGRDAVVADVVGRGGARTPLTVAGTGGYAGPITVHVDGGTASAAEVLMVALQQGGRARVIGSRTFGKCLVHEGTSLPDGGQVLFTSGRLAEPGKTPWCGQGLVPAADAPKR